MKSEAIFYHFTDGPMDILSDGWMHLEYCDGFTKDGSDGNAI